MLANPSRCDDSKLRSLGVGVKEEDVVKAAVMLQTRWRSARKRKAYRLRQSLKQERQVAYLCLHACPIVLLAIVCDVCVMFTLNFPAPEQQAL